MLVAWAPFIRAGYGSERYYLLKTLALVPLMAAALISQWQTYILRLLLALAVWGISSAIQYLWRQRRNRIRAHYLYQALLVVLLIPNEVSWYLVWIFPVLALFLRILLDDGEALAPINAPAIILALTVAIHTGLASLTANVGQGAWLPGLAATTTSGLILTILATTSVWILLGRYYKYRIQVAFILIVLFLSGLSFYNTPQWTMPSPDALVTILIAGTFLVPDEAASPKDAGSQLVFSLMAGVTFVLFFYHDRLYQATVFAALTPSLLSPWLDDMATYGWNIFKEPQGRWPEG